MERVCRIVALVLAISIDPAFAQLPPDVPTIDGHYPGPLETFLKNAKSRRIETKVFGTLDGAEKARVTFKAIIAWDPTNPEDKLRGLAIEMAHGSCQHTAFVDVDISRPDEDLLKDSITDLQYLEDKQAEADYWKARGATEAGTSTTLQNVLPPLAKVPGLTQAILNVGWWTPKDGNPLLTFKPMTCRNLLFPKATMTDVIKAMSAAHDYLWSH